MCTGNIVAVFFLFSEVLRSHHRCHRCSPPSVLRARDAFLEESLPETPYLVVVRLLA